MISLGIAYKISLILLVIFVASVICVISLPIFESAAGGACKALADCDPFLPICATHTNEHQFFYSHCDMLRENCLTGKGEFCDPQ